MKLVLTIFVICTLIARIQSACNGISSLYLDFFHFDRLIPTRTFNEFTGRYFLQEANARIYMQESAEFKSYLRNFQKTNVYNSLLKFLCDFDFPVKDFLQKFQNGLGNNKTDPSEVSSINENGKLADLYKDLKRLHSYEFMKKLFDEKMESSPVYRQLIVRLHSKEFKELLSKLLSNSEFLSLVKLAGENGVPVMDFFEYMAFHYGLLFTPDELQ